MRAGLTGKVFKTQVQSEDNYSDPEQNSDPELNNKNVQQNINVPSSSN